MPLTVKALVVAALACIVGVLLAAFLLSSLVAPTSFSQEDLRKLVAELEKKRKLGYDVLKAEYYLFSARYHYRAGNREKAVRLTLKARELLERAEPLPTLPEREWKAAESNVWVSRVPTVWDFVPVGTVFVRTKSGYLAYPRGDTRWKLSCFIVVAMGQTEDGRVFVYQGRLPLMPEEAPLRPKLYLGGRWLTPRIVFAGPLYFDEGERFGLPTVYQYDLSGEYMQYLSYDEGRRLWIHAIRSLRSGETLLEIRARAVGVPMWLGEWNGSFPVHGVYPRAKDFDLWGGFWDVGAMNATVSVGGRTYRVKGVLCSTEPPIGSSMERGGRV
mgnify:CR=1 FL=1